MNGKTILSLSVGLLAWAAAAAPLVHYPMDALESPVKNYGTAANADAQPYLLHEDSFTPGVVGNALRIYGMSDGYRLENPGKVIPGSCTLSFYFRPERLSERMTLASFYMGSEEILALKIQNKHLVLLDWAPKAQRRSYTAKPELSVNEWHHAAWTMDGTNWTLFLDGQEVLKVASTSLPGNLPVKMLYIGNDCHPVVSERDRFVGSLDEFQISDTALTAEALQAAAAKTAQSAPFAAPEYAAGKIIGADEKEIAAHVDLATQSFVFDGQKSPMTVFVIGAFLNGGYSMEVLPDVAKTGITVLRAGIAGGRDFCSGNWWYDDDKYDFEIVDRYLDILFKEYPDARLMLTIAMSPPDWWGCKHPEEVCKDSQGRMRQDYYASHSYSSKRWLEDLDKALAALFEHMKTRPYYKRVIGVAMVSGRYGECLRAGYNSQLYGKEITDYSDPEVAAYRAWLEKRYGTMAKMKAAYKNGVLPDTFAEVKIPTPEQIRRPDSSYFSDAVVDRGKIDYYTFVNDQSAQAVCEYTSMVRKYAGPDKVLGLYYGYMLEDAAGHGRAWASDSGHFGLAKVLRDAPVDFLGGPVGYTQRQLGSVGPCMGVPASLALHNKVWLDEADIRTSLSGGRAPYSGASNLEESLAVLWRTFGNTLANRAALWWMPIAGKRCYSDPAIWSAFGSMYREMAKTAEMRPANDHKQAVAVIVDEASMHFRRYSLNDNLAGNLVTYSRDAFAKAGVQADYYIDGDLDAIPDDYPVYIFLNMFYADNAKRDLIAKRLKKDNHLLVWGFGAGFFRANDGASRLSVSPANVENLTGIKVNWVQKNLSLNSVPVADAPAAIPALELKGAYKPSFVVTDPAAQALAKFTAPDFQDGTAVALKNCGTWQSLYLGTPEFKAELIRAIAKLGGVHVWSDAQNVVVHPGNGHVLIHSGHEDNVRLFFPADVKKAFDVTNDREVEITAGQATVNIGKNRTILLRLEK